MLIANTLCHGYGGIKIFGVRATRIRPSLSKTRKSAAAMEKIDLKKRAVVIESHFK